VDSELFLGHEFQASAASAAPFDVVADLSAFERTFECGAERAWLLWLFVKDLDGMRSVAMVQLLFDRSVDVVIVFVTIYYSDPLTIRWHDYKTFFEENDSEESE
jgi:hypothetical protein